MIGYKVLSRVESPYPLKSEFAGGMAEVTYIPEEWVRAPEWLAKQGYHLLVFQSEEEARFWASSSQDVWECELEGYTDSLPPRMNLQGLNKGNFLYLETTCDEGWPEDTAMARRVKLLQIVS